MSEFSEILICFFACIIILLLLKTEHFEYYNGENLEINFSSSFPLRFVDVTGYCSCLFNNFSKLILESMYPLSCVTTEISVLLGCLG